MYIYSVELEVLTRMLNWYTSCILGTVISINLFRIVETYFLVPGFITFWTSNSRAIQNYSIIVSWQPIALHFLIYRFDVSAQKHFFLSHFFTKLIHLVTLLPNNFLIWKIGINVGKKWMISTYFFSEHVKRLNFILRFFSVLRHESTFWSTHTHSYSKLLWNIFGNILIFRLFKVKRNI